MNKAKDTRPAAFRQNVTINLRVVVRGTMDDFMIDQEDLQEKIRRHIFRHTGYRLDQIAVHNGPSSVRFYFPEELDQLDETLRDRGAITISIGGLDG